MFTLLMWTLFDFGHYSSLGVEDANNHIIPASITDAFVIRPLDSVIMYGSLTSTHHN